MKDNIIKGALTLLLAGAAAYFQQILGPLIVLIIMMVIDYITGIAAAWVKRELSSRTGIVGIVKKIGYLCTIAVAVVVDYIIARAVITAKPELDGLNIFGLLVTIWLILNECISILENLSEIGVPLPAFLKAIVRRLKKTTEEKGNDAADQIAPPVESDPDTRPEDFPEPEDYFTHFGIDGSLPEPFSEDVAPHDDKPPDAE